MFLFMVLMFNNLAFFFSNVNNYVLSFPKNPDLLKEWLTAIRRKNFEPSIYSRICSNHFTEESFETSGWSCVPKLKIDAVPSIFDFRKTLPKRKRARPYALQISINENTWFV